MSITRPFRFSNVCTPCILPINFCCLQDLTVTAANGQVLGHVVQRWSLCAPRFDVRDASGATVLEIRGPICICQCAVVNFEVYAPGSSQPIGRISKQWGGLVKEL